MKRTLCAIAVAVACLLLPAQSADAAHGRRGRKKGELRESFKKAARKRAQYPFNRASGGDKSGAQGRSLHLPPPRVDGTPKKTNNKKLPGPKK